MHSFKHQHKHHIQIWLALILVSLLSGFVAFYPEDHNRKLVKLHNSSSDKIVTSTAESIDYSIQNEEYLNVTSTEIEKNAKYREEIGEGYSDEIEKVYDSLYKKEENPKITITRGHQEAEVENDAVTIISDKTFEDHEIPVYSTKDATDEVKEDTNTENEIDFISVTLKIEGKEYLAELHPGVNVYDLMDRVREETGLTFSGREYSGLGFFVDEINSLKNSPFHGKYWIYYINGVIAKQGISQYYLNHDDIIEWKYEEETL